MNWLTLTLIAPFLWAIVNHTDKYLLSRYFKSNGGVGPLMIFSTLFGAAMLPLAISMEPRIFSISGHDILILIISGIISSVAIALYLYALDDDEASVVVPFWQTIPIFGYMLGYFLFRETLSSAQIVAGLGILIGALILIIDFESRRKFKFKIAILMLSSSFLFASYEALFKYVAIKENFWISTFWGHVGLIIFGLFLITFFKKHRQGFWSILKGNKMPIMLLNIGSETLTLIGNTIINYALILAPLALVLLASSYQPAFVLLIGIIITIFFPSFSSEKISRVYLTQKFVAITIICVSSYFLNYGI